MDSPRTPPRHDTHTPCCSIPTEHVWADPIRCLRDLETWPCAAMIEDGPPDSDGGLDVERLTRVLAEHFGPSYFPGMTDVTIHGTSPAAIAEQIAAEYLRLQSTDPSPGEPR